jgi:hypothetical protein
MKRHAPPQFPGAVQFCSVGENKLGLPTAIFKGPPAFSYKPNEFNIFQNANILKSGQSSHLVLFEASRIEPRSIENDELLFFRCN